MRIDDPVYGTVQLTEPVLLDLLASAALQRLKGVLQHGITGLIGVTSPITRYEHSLGVMILVRRLGASIDEQIAALLHDVSHTVFSHVIDYVYDGHDSQGYHDEHMEAYVATTDVPQVLERHGRDWHDFLQVERFKLLEQPSPRLCADRLDYFLRDSLALGLAGEEEVQQALAHLAVVAGRIVVNDLGAAQWIGHTYIAADDVSWANLREVGLYEVTAQAIRRALHLEIITPEDFWLTDLPVWERLAACADHELQAFLGRINPETQFVWDEDEPTFCISTKVRSIDPDVFIDGRVAPLSSLDPGFASHREAYLKAKQGKWPIRVVTG